MLTYNAVILNFRALLILRSNGYTLNTSEAQYMYFITCLLIGLSSIRSSVGQYDHYGCFLCW